MLSTDQWYRQLPLSLVSRTVPFVIPTLAILVLTGSEAAWVLRDESVWNWDQAWYGQVTLDLDHTRASGLTSWIDAMLRAIGDKPPLLSWLAQMFVPLTGLFGSTEVALLMLNVVIEFATLALVYSVSRRLGAGCVASLGAMFLCGGASLHMGLATQFVVEPLQSLSATGLIWAAWRSERLQLFALLSRVFFCVAVAFLAKSSSFVFVVPLLTYIVVARIIDDGAFKDSINLFDYFVGALALLFVAMAIAWYVISWTPMVRHFTESVTTNDISLLYGHRGFFWEKVAFWIGALSLSLSPSPWLLICILIPISIAFACCWKGGLLAIRALPKEALKTGLLFAGVLAGIAILIVVGLANQVVEDPRYLAPIIPVLATLFSWSLGVVRNAIATWLLVAATISNALVGIAFVHRLEHFNLSFASWLRQYEPDPRMKRMLTETVDLTCERNHQRYIFVGVEYYWFSANPAAFYSAKGLRPRGFRCQYTSLGYAEKNPQAAIDRLRAAKPEYFVTIAPERQVKPPDAFNQVNLPVLDMMAADPHFKLLDRQSPDVLIFKRIGQQPVSREEFRSY